MKKVYLIGLIIVTLFLGGGVYLILFTNEKGHEKVIQKKIVNEKLSPRPPIIINDFHDVQLIYSTNNGSLPPQYHRETNLTISESAAGLITANLETRNYSKVIEKKNLTVSQEQFKDLVNTALGYQHSDSYSGGCTGSSYISLKVLKENKKLIEVAADSCGGNSVYKSLEEFSNIIDK